MRGSFNGKTSVFQTEVVSSILSRRTKKIDTVFIYLTDTSLVFILILTRP